MIRKIFSICGLFTALFAWSLLWLIIIDEFSFKSDFLIFSALLLVLLSEFSFGVKLAKEFIRLLTLFISRMLLLCWKIKFPSSKSLSLLIFLMNVLLLPLEMSLFLMVSSQSYKEFIFSPNGVKKVSSSLFIEFGWLSILSKTENIFERI